MRLDCLKFLSYLCAFFVYNYTETCTLRNKSNKQDVYQIIK